MFRVNERRHTAGLLGVGDHVEHQRGFAGGFRPENLNDPSARETADPEADIERKCAGGDHLDLDVGAAGPEPHDAPFAVRLGDAGDGGVQLAVMGGVALCDGVFHLRLRFVCGFLRGLFRALFCGFGRHTYFQFFQGLQRPR